MSMLNDIFGQADRGHAPQPPPHRHHHPRHGLGHRYRRPSARLRSRFRPRLRDHLRPVRHERDRCLPRHVPASRPADPRRRQVRLQMDDVERIQETVPGILHVSPVMWKQVPVQNDLHTYTWDVNGIAPELQDIQKMKVGEGRVITTADVMQRKPTSRSSVPRPSRSFTPECFHSDRRFV